MTQYPDIRFRKDWTPDAKYDWYQVMEDCKMLDSDLIIPNGFVTDFSSVPRLIWTLIPPYGKSVNPSILHDYMYVNGVYSAWFGSKTARYVADRLFYQHLREAGVSKLQSYLMYAAVRIFGKSRYNVK